MSNREAGQNVTFNPKTFIKYLIAASKQTDACVLAGSCRTRIEDASKIIETRKTSG